VKPADEAAARTIAALLGETKDATTPDEIAWAFRKTLEQAAAQRPLACVFDDVHWGEPAFLDLVEHVSDFSRGAPILLLCLGRPELLDRRPGWSGGKVNATTILLEPLTAVETEELIERLGELSGELKARIQEAAEGNPLFVEEMLAMVRETHDADIAVPPSIQALLAARLDQLDAPERTVLERGAVEGKVFHRGAVEALAPDEPEAPQRLMALVRKELIRPDQPQIPGDDAFRFRHLLIRDAAYDALPKATRAELHERFAAWLEEFGAELVELDEILGYHLEQAALYRAELGTPDGAVGARAARHLLAAGRRALLRDDGPAAAALLSRACDLLPSGARDDVLIDLSRPLARSGEFEQLRSAVEELKSSADPRSRAYGVLFEVELWRSVDPARVVADGEPAAAEAAATFSELGDERGLALASQARFDVYWMQSRSIPAHAAVLETREHASRSGDAAVSRQAIAMGHGVLMFGYLPVEEALLEIETMQQAAGESVVIRTAMLQAKGYVLGLQGGFAEGLQLIVQARDLFMERGDRVMHGAIGHAFAIIALLARDPDAAVEDLRRSVRELEELGEHGFRSTSLALLAVALQAAGDPDEAERMALASEELSAADDYINFAYSRAVRALLVAERGQLDEAEKLARSAVEYAFRTDFPLVRADALAALARALRSAGREAEAEDALAQAVGFYEAKGAGACLGRLFEIAGARRT
jgi:hypothetical protein